MFRRRRRGREQAPVDPDSFVDDLDPEDREYEDRLLLAEIEEQEREQARRATRPQGPWDADDAPEDDLPRVDLGALRVPVPPGTEVRVELGPENEVLAATLAQEAGAMQVNVFAAPRSEGIWDEVRAEIAESLTSGGGAAQEADGPYGPELHAEVPVEVPGEGVGRAPARFVGVDGPRWFLRALLTGPAAVHPDAAEPLLAALRDVVVVRGSAPMAVRDPLPLHLPPAAVAQPGDLDDELDDELDDDQLDGEDGPDADGGLALPRRGPEITETR